VEQPEREAVGQVVEVLQRQAQPDAEEALDAVVNPGAQLRAADVGADHRVVLVAVAHEDVVADLHLAHHGQVEQLIVEPQVEVVVADDIGHAALRREAGEGAEHLAVGPQDRRQRPRLREVDGVPGDDERGAFSVYLVQEPQQVPVLGHEDVGHRPVAEVDVRDDVVDAFSGQITPRLARVLSRPLKGTRVHERSSSCGPFHHGPRTATQQGPTLDLPAWAQEPPEDQPAHIFKVWPMSSIIDRQTS
jgi:hypothetical protein